jgi:hypothetical protein
MLRRRIAAAACAVMTVATLAACSQSSSGGAGGLAASSSSPQSLPSVASPAASTAAGTTATATPPPATSRPKHSSTPRPPNSPSASPAPDSTDYGVAWSNANCTWNVDSDGKATINAIGAISASVSHQSGTVKVTFTNDGSLPTTSDTYPAKLLTAGSPSGFIAQSSAPVTTVAGHTITFTATLTFDGVTDNLAADNVESLKIVVPLLFLPNAGGDENLGCSHG